VGSAIVVAEPRARPAAPPSRGAVPPSPGIPRSGARGSALRTAGATVVRTGGSQRRLVLSAPPGRGSGAAGARFDLHDAAHLRPPLSQRDHDGGPLSRSECTSRAAPDARQGAGGS